jgi:hypothetical protein
VKSGKVIRNINPLKQDSLVKMLSLVKMFGKIICKNAIKQNSCMLGNLVVLVIIGRNDEVKSFSLNLLEYSQRKG